MFDEQCPECDTRFTNLHAICGHWFRIHYREPAVHPGTWGHSSFAEIVLAAAEARSFREWWIARKLGIASQPKRQLHSVSASTCMATAASIGSSFSKEDWKKILGASDGYFDAEVP